MPAVQCNTAKRDGKRVTRTLETMQHHLISLADFLVGEELFHDRALVARQLDHVIAGLFVLHHRTVAVKVLLESLHDTLHIEVIGKTGHRGDALAPAALLHAHMHFVACVAGCGVARIRERVCVNDGNAR